MKVLVTFSWEDVHGRCDDCGLPAAFKGIGNTDAILCAICAANHAADCGLIERIEEDE